MNKKITKIIAFILTFALAFIVGCGDSHDCAFTVKNRSEKFLKEGATCQNRARYYYSCECGKKGEEVFEVGTFEKHDYSKEVVGVDYFSEPATCLEEAKYFKSCTFCGQKSTTQTFYYGELGSCSYINEIAEDKFLKSEATFTDSAIYYKSCVCGKVGEETFNYGDKLRSDYTEEEKLAYTPTSITVSLYDPENYVYGFTYNTDLAPLRPVIQIAKGNSLSSYEEYSLSIKQASSYDASDNVITYYIVKGEVELEKNTTYTYRVYDKYVGVGSEETTLTTKDSSANKFSFAHVSDSQGSSVAFKNVLRSVENKVDFLLHTGDVVEESKYESDWDDMLNGNFEYLSKMPIMAISGNHETTYKNGVNETFNHFNNNIPTQNSTNLGYFYSFSYGNAKFIMLNTNDLSGSRLTTEQYNWLVRELQNNTKTWTIVAMHNPIYSVGKYGVDPTKNSICLGLRAQLQSIFAEYKVDIVLQGHDHAISRTYPINGSGEPKEETFEKIGGIDYSINPNGVIYLMNGPGGTQTRGPVDIDHSIYSYAEGSQASSWADIEIDGNVMTITVQYAGNGNPIIYHKWGIKKI